MKRSEIMKWVVGAILVAAAVTVIFASSGCEISKEIIIDPEGRLPPIERVVIEGPGGDMVGVGVETVTRLAPLLPEPWNTILVAIAGGFTFATAGWVFRNVKKK